jgi:hypothetical protein
MAPKKKGQGMKIKDRIVAALRSAGVWFNAALLVAFPFTAEIMQGVNDYLPSLAPYLPPNVYKAVGFAVVVFNMVQAMRRAHAAAVAKGAPHG